MSIDSSTFISELITPIGQVRDTAAMARGEPGMPEAFIWRDRQYTVQRVMNTWKHSSPEATGEVYLRRPYFELFMDSDEAWVVYFQRRASRSGHPRRRWYLYSIKTSPTRE